MGPNIFGVKAASKYYFHREPIDVTPEQAAFLVFLLPNPKTYHQSFQKQALTPSANKMVRTILHKMNIGKNISDQEYQVAVNKVAEFPWNGMVAKSESIVSDEQLNFEPLEDGEENQDDNKFKFDFDVEGETK